MDCHTREVLYWRLSPYGNAKAAEAALEEALTTAAPGTATGLIKACDRGGRSEPGYVMPPLEGAEAELWRNHGLQDGSASR